MQQDTNARNNFMRPLDFKSQCGMMHGPRLVQGRKWCGGYTNDSKGSVREPPPERQDSLIGPNVRHIEYTAPNIRFFVELTSDGKILPSDLEPGRSARKCLNKHRRTLEAPQGVGLAHCETPTVEVNLVVVVSSHLVSLYSLPP